MQCREYPLFSKQGKDGVLNGFCEDREGNIFITTKRGEVLRYEKSTDEFTALTNGQIADPGQICQDLQEDYYWVATWGEGIVRLDVDSTGISISYPVIRNHNDKNDVIYFVQKDSILWATTIQSLCPYMIRDGQAQYISPSKPLPDNVMLNEIMQNAKAICGSRHSTAPASSSTPPIESPILLPPFGPTRSLWLPTCRHGIMPHRLFPTHLLAVSGAWRYFSL